MKARSRGGARDDQKAEPHVLGPPQRNHAPSIASHRNRMEASSSDQVSGRLKT